MKRKVLHPAILMTMAIYFLVGGVVLLKFDKGELVLWVNENHIAWADVLMKHWTYLGDASLYVILFLVAIFYRYYYAFLAVSTGFFTLIFSQGLKRTLFSDWPRPLSYFEDVQWNLVEGVEMHLSNTFPSGHSLTAFSIFILISCFIGKRSLYIPFILLAIGVAVSRVYLLQHFFVDVYFGGLLGFAAVVVGVNTCDYLLGERLIAKFKSTSLLKNTV